MNGLFKAIALQAAFELWCGPYCPRDTMRPMFWREYGANFLIDPMICLALALSERGYD